MLKAKEPINAFAKPFFGYDKILKKARIHSALASSFTPFSVSEFTLSYAPKIGEVFSELCIPSCVE